MKKTFTSLFIILALSIASIKAQNIFPGIHYTVFKCSDGTAESCGFNLQGQLGIGTNTTQPNPTQVSNLTNIKKVSSGGTHALYLLNDSSVWATGYNSYQQLGDGGTQDKNVPTVSTTLNSTKAIDISAGQYHSLVLTKENTVYAFGQNSNGQLGRGNTTNDYTTSLVPNLNNVIAISAGYSHSLFLKNDGTVWACGSNVWGELGIGGTDNSNKSTPLQVQGITNIVGIAAGKANGSNSYFLKNDGTVWACGTNGNGQLGDGTTTNRFEPVQVSGLANITSMKIGTGHALFLKNDGTVWSCGENQYGQAGNGTITADNLTPIQASQISNVAEIATGNGYSFFLKNDGTLWGCGRNNNGSLGDGTQTNRTVTTQLTNICSMSVGVENAEQSINMNIYPNPFQNTLNIEIKNINELIELEIVNIIGEVIYHDKLNNSKTRIEVNSLTSGVYFIKIRTPNLITIKKIIKE